MRVRQAGNVWIKIADYGISQVSTGLTLRVGTSPVGTPGFMAPELFDKIGQEISAEKVQLTISWLLKLHLQVLQ
jgi:serine/threonine protein kinase